MSKSQDRPTRLSVGQLVELSRNAGGAVVFRGSDLLDTDHLSSSSFGYEADEVGLRSTQQLKVDWSDFANHTFFQSAAAKTNVAFERIVNGYPFDGTRREVERFVDSLTGFEKYVLDSFPKNRGYLLFSSSYIAINDSQGSTFPELSSRRTGVGVLDPGADPYTVEYFLYLPSEAAGTQVVFQKQASGVGLSAYVKSGSSSSTAEVAWALYSGSFSVVASASVPRGAFAHVANVYDRDNDGKAKVYVDGVLAGTSEKAYQFESLDTSNAAVYVGSGSAFLADGATVTPDKVLSGALDELRVFSEARTDLQLQRYRSRNVLATDSMLLCYRFNEPTGSLGGTESASINSVVLDSSGNGLHSFVTNFTHSLRSTGSVSPPLTNERDDLNPVLFPGFSDVTALNARMLLSASSYDDANPNLITRLVPPHYLTDGQEFEGLLTEAGSIADSPTGTSAPGSARLGSTQLFLGLLYTWAKFFDEIKLFVDAFSRLHYVDYDEKDTSPDVFLRTALREFGFDVPNFFSDASFAQYQDGEDVEPTYSLNDRSLRSVQNAIVRRVLTNMGEIVRSKGTIHSVETFFRSVGVDPNNSFKIKERGGPTTRTLDGVRLTRIEPQSFLDLSRGGSVSSGFLSSSRLEKGIPDIAGTLVNPGAFPPYGVSDSPKDGLWTSGSWTYEAVYRWPTTGSHQTQSLVRLCTTASAGASERVLANLVAVSGSSPSIALYARPDDSAGAATLVMTASVDLFDRQPWYVSFGRIRNDLTGTVGAVSSSYFLRAMRLEGGELGSSFSSSSLFLDGAGGANCAWQTVTSTNESGSFLRLGSGSITRSGNQFLNATSGIPSDALVTFLEGQVTRVRFWSKALDDDEWVEHARNPASLGVKDPNVEFNFAVSTSGSWQRLRVDASTQQDTVSSDVGGTLTLFDYSQNGKHLAVSGLPASTQVLLPSLIGYSHISSDIDEAYTSDKVRVRGYEDLSKVEMIPWAQAAPAYEVPPNEEPQDDARLSIEFSLVDALNRDIILAFATLDALDDALGAPQNDFSTGYHDLEHLKEVYFHRLVGKLNFRAFFDFFRWFDSSVAYFVEQLVPRKTVYYGTHFVVESHLLERHRKQYFHYGMYLSEADRPLIEDRILLQQISGILRKF